MAINFPDNPNVGQSEYIAGIRYYFDGIGWTAAVSNTLGTRRTKEFLAQNGDYIFPTQFDLDNAELYINGIKIESAEYSVSADNYNASIILNSPISGTDIPVEIVAYGTYDILNEIYIKSDSEPDNPFVGMLWLNITENILYIYTGTEWKNTTTLELYALATETTDGLMSSTDKIIINNLDNKYDPIGEAVALSIALG